MVKHPLKYHQNVSHHLERVRSGYRRFMDTMNIPNIGLLKVIDVGFASASVLNQVLLPLLPKNVKEIVVSDMDEEGSLDLTRSITKDSRLKFEKLDIQGKSVPEHLQGRFDLLFSAYCFSYIRDIRQGFKNSGRLLKPDGQFLNLFQYKKNVLYTTYQSMSRMDKWKVYTQDYANFRNHLSGENPEEELKKMFKDIGMTLVRYEFDPDNCFPMTKGEVLGAYKSLDRKYPQVPKQQQNDYMNDFIKVLSEETQLDLTKNLDETVEFPIPTVTVHAKN